MDNEWQKVLDRFSYGIYVISVKDGHDDNAMIASWVTQCSHEPPLIAVAIRENRLSHEQILKSGTFSLGILSREQTDLVKRFKIADWKHKFEGLATTSTASGHLLPQSVIGYIDLDLDQMIKTGDHTLFIGKITYGKFFSDIRPMTTIDYGGCYRGAA